MVNTNDVLRAHKLLDSLFDNSELSHAQIDLIRDLMPELPKQKTLAELLHMVYDAWAGADGNKWDDEAFGELETWLDELHAQLKGLETIAPALPTGMRLADHEEYGRVVVSPNDDENNLSCRIFYVDEVYVTDSYSRYVETSSLTFIDSEPAPAHPEFLETEEDYKNAPEGTIVACDDSPPWHKFNSEWLSTITYGYQSVKIMSGVRRQILRWGWGE